jgi:hypothetical protein
VASRLGRKEWAAGAGGAALVAQLFVLRALGAANETSVWFAGRELQWGCAVRRVFGVPCPSCGLTRSVVLTVHGRLETAVALNPAGPLYVLGMLLLGAALFAVMLRPLFGARAPGEDFPRRLLLSASAYGGLVVATMLVNWLLVVAR